jgi:hypothetical protein
VRAVATHPPLRLAFFALLALVASWPLLASPKAINTFRDAHVLAHYESVARDSILRFGQLPLWDPYYCGGMYLLGTPQSRFVSPTFALSLLFGEFGGEALAAFAMFVVGLEGAFRYSRTRRASATGAFLAAPIFGLGGVFAYSSRLGWINFFGFALLPWIAAGLRRAFAGDRRGAIVAAACIAWCAGFGGTYAVPLAAVWCAFETLEATALAARGAHDRRRRFAAIAWAALLVVMLGVGIGAVRLWPVAETLADAPRVVGGTPGNGYPALAKMLFLNLQQDDSPDGQFFIGALALPAALVALVARGRRRGIALVIYGWLWVWLAAGYGVSPSIFAATHALPVYGTLRYPERYLILFGLVACALAAQGVTRAAALARARRNGRPLRFARALHLGVMVSLLLAVGPLVYQQVRSGMTRELAPQPITIDRPFHQARGNRLELAYYEPMARGSLSCWDAYPVPESPLLEGDLAEEERLEDPAAGHVTLRSWSPNRIDLDVDLQRPARLRVNQNWHRGWRTNVGQIWRERGLLVVDLPEGAHAVSLRFAPRSASGGLLVTIASIAAALFVAKRRAPSSVGLALAAVAPLASFLLACAVIPEPPPAPAVPMAPTGEAIVVDELPRRAARIGTRFEAGVTLVGASIDAKNPRPGSTVVLELDWTREAKVDAGLGVFVHIDPSRGDGLNGDHVELSQTLLLEAAPAGKILRDLLPIVLPKDANGKEWTISVGLWRIRRGGARVRVVDDGQGNVAGDEVTIGKFTVR